MAKPKSRLRKLLVWKKGALTAGVASIGLFSLFSFGVPAFVATTYQAGGTATTTPEVPALKPAVKHLPTPKPLKGIYMSQCVAGTPSFRDSLVSFIDETELNAVVIDIRDYTGKISFPTDHPDLVGAVSDACGAKDMKEFIAKLHEKNIYVIGRITTFQNPYWTKIHPEQAVQRKGGGVWKDYKGLAFVDVGAKPYWDNVVLLGKISYELGFDELNFDYIRYPSDGPMKEAVYSWEHGKKKPEMLEEFYAYITEKLRPADPSRSAGRGQAGPVLSADLFGMTATNEDDLNIGQVLERTLPYFDAVYPMVYPSHYPSGFNGWKNVNEHPYDIVKFSMSRALSRTIATSTRVASLAHTAIASTSPQLYQKPIHAKEKMIPWLQSFDYPVPYTPAMVRGQIQATYDAGIDSWLFWDAANKYSSLRKVLEN